MGASHESGPLVVPGGFQITDGQAIAAATTQSRHERITAPIAAELISIVADISMAAGAQTIAAQPDYPRKLQVRITDADSSVTAGTCTIVGTDQDGKAISEVVTLTGGTATKITANAFGHVTSATLAALAGNAAADHISIGVGAALGLPTCAAPAVTGFVVSKENVSNGNEAVGTVDATARTVVPTSAPNAVLNFDFWYSFVVTAPIA